MARKQEEIPGTRRPDEPQPQKPIKALDDASDVLVKAKGKATRAGQGVVEAKKVVQQLLIEHDLQSYEYEENDVLKKHYRKETLASCKVKVAKKSAPDDGDDE